MPSDDAATAFRSMGELANSKTALPYLKDHLQSGALVELLSDYRPAEEAVWAVYPNRRHLPQKVRLMVQHLQAGLS